MCTLCIVAEVLDVFAIYISNENLNPNKAGDKLLCISVNIDFPAGETKTFECTRPANGR